MIGGLVQRIHFCKDDLPALVDDEYRSFADAGDGRPFSQDPECAGDLAVGEEIRAHRQVHRPDFFFLPRYMAEDRICAYVQDLGIERGKLLAVRVESRQLRRSSWGPVQRMKSHHNMLFPAKITQPDLDLPLALHCGQRKVRGHIPNF
jgi:hypothetical protein